MIELKVGAIIFTFFLCQPKVRVLRNIGFLLPIFRPIAELKKTQEY